MMLQQHHLLRLPEFADPLAFGMDGFHVDVD